MKCKGRLTFAMLFSITLLPFSVWANWNTTPTSLDEAEQHIDMAAYLQAILDERKHQHILKTYGEQQTALENDKSTIQLGYGYSTERDDMLLRSCFNPGVHRWDNESNYLNIDKRWTRAQLKQHFGFTVGANVNFKMFNASNETKFTYDSAENIYGENFTFYSGIRTETVTVNPTRPNDSNFTPEIQHIIDRPDNSKERFKAMCGDKVIAQVNLGGELFMNVQLNFYNRKDRAVFKNSTNVSVIPLVDLTTKIKSVMEFFLDTGEIKIMALQIGGSAARLNEILQSEDPNNPFPIIRCKFEDLGSCQAMLGALAHYASSEFPKQFVDRNSPDYKPAVYEYEIEEYTAWNNGENPSAEPVIDPEVMKIRRTIGKDYEQAVEDIARAAMLYAVILSPSHKKKLEAVSELLVENVGYYAIVATSCFKGSKAQCLRDKQYYYDEFINDPERYVDRKLIYPPYEEWALKYTMLRFDDRRCQSQWYFNSTDQGKNLYNTYTSCAGVAPFMGVGHLWQTAGDKTWFSMSAFTEPHGLEMYYGERDGTQIKGQYISENKDNLFYEKSRNISTPLAIERDFEGGITQKDPDTSLPLLGECNA